MRYTIRHTTRFDYETPISESVMEARMQPRTDAWQRCLHFALSTVPGSRVMVYEDHDRNIIHHFNVPGRHSRLTVNAQTLVETKVLPEVPEHLPADAWQRLDAMTGSGEFWDVLAPSQFAERTDALFALARSIGFRRGVDPLTTLRELMAVMYREFEYCPQTTHVDSRIDEALEARRGVCQDFSHIFISLARHVGIPTRYVSGYLFQDDSAADRSADGATHAWTEALMPEIGWVGFDPTNNVIARERHVRVAIGRDYADVPPTRGVYKGVSAVRTELAVSVRVGPVPFLRNDDAVPFTPWMSRDATVDPRDAAADQQQQ